jgi:hypothetical protein
MHMRVVENLFYRHLCVVFRLVVCERQIPMLNHVFNLSFHCNTEECDKVHDENGPKDRYVENFKERAKKRDCCGFGYSVPKLKFR